MQGRWFESNLGQPVKASNSTRIFSCILGLICVLRVFLYFIIFRIMKFWARKFFRNRILANFIYEFAILYPTPSNLSYFWNFGFLALVCLVFQIITGIILAMHYTPHVDLAFLSVEHIMRDVNYGFFLRYAHANGASAFFFIVYLHLLKGLYYGSYAYPRQIL